MLLNALQNRRRKGRLPQESIACNLGPVVDFSASGLRAICHRVPHGRIDVDLFGHDVRLRVQGEVIWSRRRGLFKHEVGIRFIGVDEALARALSNLSTDSRMRRQIINDRVA